MSRIKELLEVDGEPSYQGDYIEFVAQFPEGSKAYLSVVTPAAPDPDDIVEHGQRTRALVVCDFADATAVQSSVNPESERRGFSFEVIGADGNLAVVAAMFGAAAEAIRGAGGPVPVSVCREDGASEIIIRSGKVPSSDEPLLPLINEATDDEVF